MKKEKSHKLYREMGFYERYIKRAIDIFCSGLAIIVFCWLYAIIALLVRLNWVVQYYLLNIDQG